MNGIDVITFQSTGAIIRSRIDVQLFTGYIMLLVRFFMRACMLVCVCASVCGWGGLCICCSSVKVHWNELDGETVVVDTVDTFERKLSEFEN